MLRLMKHTAARENPIFADAAPSAQVCIVSPLTRTLETATLGLQGLPVPLVACHYFQECSAHASDTGRPTAELQVTGLGLRLGLGVGAPFVTITLREAQFPAVDFAVVPPDWFEKVGHWDFIQEEGNPQVSSVA
jgi:hypothetical protein